MLEHRGFDAEVLEIHHHRDLGAGIDAVADDRIHTIDHTCERRGPETICQPYCKIRREGRIRQRNIERTGAQSGRESERVASPAGYELGVLARIGAARLGRDGGHRAQPSGTRLAR